MQQLEQLPTTKEHLLEVTVKLLEEWRPEELTSAKVLAEAEISKGSLYHHYHDFSELLESAQALIFSNFVDGAVEEVLQFVSDTDDPIRVRSKFHFFASSPQFTGSKRLRNKLIRLSFHASSNDRMRDLIAPAQERLTTKWMQIFDICLARGWASSYLDARASSIIIQSVIMGRVIDDNSSNQVTPTEWSKAMALIFDTFFFGNLNRTLSSTNSQSGQDPLIILNAGDPKAAELLSAGFMLESEYLSSELKVNENPDISNLIENYLKAIYNLYQIELLGQEYLGEVTDLFRNSDISEVSSLTFREVEKTWSENSVVAGAFRDGVLVGVVNANRLNGQLVISRGYVSSDHRSKGVCTAVVAYMLMIQINEGFHSFVASGEVLNLSPINLLTNLGFVEQVNTQTFARSE